MTGLSFQFAKGRFQQLDKSLLAFGIYGHIFLPTHEAFKFKKEILECELLRHGPIVAD